MKYKSNFLPYIIISFLILFNLTIRYPKGDYESGMDTFTNFSRANTLIYNGNEITILNFISYFGLYPFSYNTGGTFLLSTTSLVSSLGISFSILTLNYFLTILSILSCFFLCRQINRNLLFFIILVTLFSTQRTFLEGTRWSYSFRTVFVSMIPIFYNILISLPVAYKEGKIYKYIFLVSFLCIALFSIHRIFLFAVITLLVFLLSLLSYDSFIKKFSHKSTRHQISFILPFLFISFSMLIFPFTRYGFYGIGLINFSIERGQEYFLEDRNLWISMINISLQYAMSLGFFTVLAPIGYVYLIRKVRFTNTDNFLIFSLLSFTFFWPDIIYTRTYFSLLIIFYITFGLYNLLIHLPEKVKKGKSVIIFIIILTSVQLSPDYIIISNQEPDFEEYPVKIETQPSVFNTAMHQKYMFSSNPQVTNVGFIGSKVAAYSGTHSPKIPESFTNSNLDLLSLSTLFGYDVNHIFDVDSPYSNNLEYDVYLPGYSIYDTRTELSFKNIFGTNESTYNILVANFALESYDSRFYNNLTVFPFFQEVNTELYKTYDDGLIQTRFLTFK